MGQLTAVGVSCKVVAPVGISQDYTARFPALFRATPFSVSGLGAGLRSLGALRGLR